MDGKTVLVGKLSPRATRWPAADASCHRRQSNRSASQRNRNYQVVNWRPFHPAFVVRAAKQVSLFAVLVDLLPIPGFRSVRHRQTTKQKTSCPPTKRTRNRYVSIVTKRRRRICRRMMQRARRALRARRRTKMSRIVCRKTMGRLARVRRNGQHSRNVTKRRR